MKKYLIIRFSSIGDIVLTTPVIRCLKEQTGAEVHYLSKRPFKGLLQPNPHIDKLYLIDAKVDEVLPQLKAEGYHEIIDLHNNLRTLQVKRALGVPAHSFPKLNIQKFILVNLKINLLPDVHIVERYMQTVAHLGVKNDDKGLDYFLTEEDELALEAVLPEAFLKGYVAFVIGGQHEGKMCSPKRLPLFAKPLQNRLCCWVAPKMLRRARRFPAKPGNTCLMQPASSGWAKVCTW
jgi:ADP-heptose:LPS heptosyltransferase